MIELTEKAVSRVVTMAAREDCEPWFRIAVRGGGCSGLSYVVEFDGDAHVIMVSGHGHVPAFSQPDLTFIFLPC